MRILSEVRITPVALSLIVPILAMLSFADAYARSGPGRGSQREAESTHSPKTALPNPQQRVHRLPDVQISMTNWGLVGSQMRDLYESLGGCFSPDPGEELPAPSFEFPAGSGLEYLFHGGIWIGAMVNDYPYTTVACDGWEYIYELWPEAWEEGAINERSVLPTVPCYSPHAVSSQDIIAEYTDTSADIPLSPWNWDPWDDRKHVPLNVGVTQTSYSWGTDGADKFIIVEYTIENIGVRLLSGVCIGFYVDGDALHIDENPYGAYGAQDDITGFLRNYEVSPGDVREVDVAWIADNDGHGRAGEVVWTEFSPRSVLGMKVLSTPNPDLQISYNWWVSNFTGYPRDWGPWIASNLDVWENMNPYGSGNLFPNGALGTPGGDVSKYFIMSNGEIDYDQIYSCTWPDDHPEEGWLNPSPECDDLADGYDTRFLLSFGPFDQLPPGDSLTFAVAYVIGAGFHVDPLNYPDPSNPGLFYSNLDFADLVRNVLAAESLYHDLILNDPPDPFSLLFPPNKAFTPRRVFFDWEDATDPDPSDEVRYDLNVSTSYHFSPDSTTIESNLSASEHVMTMDYGTYRWKVKAKDSRGGEKWSDQVRSFMVTGIHPSMLGDLNSDGYVNVGDLVFAMNYLYRSGPAPYALESADVNCDDLVDVADAVFLINYLFRAGPAPSCP
ncbi:MAG: dockerin type I repeat-containing protein [Candidatus Zixiibacteriota bacterium]